MSNEIAIFENQEELTPEELRQLSEEASKDLENSVFWLNVSIKGREFTVEDIPGDKDTIYAVILGVTDIRYYYDKPFVEGEENSPICFSVDGIKPVENDRIEKQHENCKECPKAIFGSRITANGKESPACSRAKRIVFTSVKKSIGMTNLIYRINVPATSIKNWNRYIQLLSGVDRLPASAVITAISFNPTVKSYPLLKFEKKGILSKILRQQASDLKNSEVTQKALRNDFVATKSDVELNNSDVAHKEDTEDDIPF